MSAGWDVPGSTTPLPMRWYFDPEVLALEQRTLFDAGPGYVGHELLVPRQGDYFVLPGAGRQVLVHGEGGPAVLSNVCRHRQARLLEGQGNARSLSCKLHGWVYDLDGTLRAAAPFQPTPCLPLNRTPVQRWQGLLFAGGRDVAADLTGFPLADAFDFTGHRLDRVETTDYDFNWKTFLEVFLELYHVRTTHPGLKRFVDPEQYRWAFGPRWSTQEMGVFRGLQRSNGSEAYRRYADAVLAWSGGEPPRWGTLWCCYYPNVMLEWYPQCLVVSTLQPLSPDRCRNVVEYYYPEAVLERGQELIAAHRAAYEEAADEDRGICEALHEGRRALYLAGEEQQGPYDQPSEDGMIHFHRWLRAELGVCTCSPSS